MIKIILLLGAVALLTACSQGDKPTASGGGQADYLDRAVSIISNCGGVDVPPSPGARDLVGPLEWQADEWDKLDPPGDLAKAHEGFGNALRRVAEILGGVDGTVAPDSDAAMQLRSALSAEKSWEDAAAARYGVSFFRNEGAAMEPTFANGDTLAVRPTDGSVERWDILVFHFPLDESRDFIKRVVGLPGETVEISDGIVHIDGAAVTGDDYALATPNYTYGPKTVPPDAYFVLGDNRRNSFDSHAWSSSCAPSEQCDFVPRTNIIGELPPDTSGCRRP